MESGELVVRPGVLELINSCKENGVKIAWVSTTPWENIRAQIDGMGGIEQETFDFICSQANQESYGVNKPAADPYLYVKRELKVLDPLVFEDSEISLKSPISAGMDTIAVPNDWCTDHDYSSA